MNHFRKLYLLGFSLLIAIAANQALAWGPQGHQMVGYIADGDLTPTAKAAVQRIMGKDSLSSVATWMDEVRDDPTLGPKMFEWHFDDVPVCNSEPAPCKDGNCAHVQIATAIDTLRQSQDPEKQLFGLRVLVHLVGDIHQPLHSSDNNDLGGNKIFLSNRRQCRDYKTKQQKVCNLHQYWDSVLIKGALGRSDEVTYAASLTSKYALPVDDSKAPTDWIAQSNKLGKDVAYGKLTGFACARPGGFTTQVSTAYDTVARQTIDQQLALAGHRLAMILNDIYK